MPVLVLTQLLENMTEVVRKGIQEAQVQLQKANEERLLEEVSLRWDFPVAQAGGRTGRVDVRQCCFAGGVAADPCGRLRAELVFSGPTVTKGKNF